MLRDDLAILHEALQRIDLERLLLLEGGKRVLKRERQTGAEAMRLAERYRADGLHVFVLREQDRQKTLPDDDGCDRVPTFTVIASREAATVEEAVEWTRIEAATGGESRLRGRARYRMGRLLGYPECCLEFYEDLDIRNDEEAVYAAWRGTHGTVRAGLNLATGFGDYSVISHAPCSFACEPSSRLAEWGLELLRREDEAAWQAAVRVSRCALLYAGERRRFLIDGEREAGGAVRYRDAQPAHYLSGEEATDSAWYRALTRGDRLVHSPDGLEVLRNGRRVASLDLRGAIRPPILLVPGETLAHRRLRVAVFETVWPDRGDLFGHTRPSLLVGDLKAAGYRVRAYTWSVPRDAPVAAEAVAKVLAEERTEAVVFVRVAPRVLLEAVRRVLPHSICVLWESGDPHDAPPDLERVPVGRLPVLRRLEALSVGVAGRSSESVLYVSPREPFHPEVQRAVGAPGLLPAVASREWEVLGRLACPYRRPAWSNPAFAHVDLDGASPLSRGCTMCSFRVGEWGRVAPGEWTDAICRQIEWVRTVVPSASMFRVVDHHGFQFLPDLLRRFRELEWAGFTLLLDARVDHVLRRDDWDALADAARFVGVRLDFTCIGFENFSQPELDRFNKGVTVAHNVAAARLVRSLWERHPDVFVRLHAAAGFVTWTPWTTLDDLRENVKCFRELHFEDFRSGLGSLRLRLYPDLPLYVLAAKDGLLLDERPPDWEEPIGYSPDHPWRFQSRETAAAYSLTQRLLRDGEPGRDVEVLDLAVRMMERRGRGRGPAEERPAGGTDLGMRDARAFIVRVLRGDIRSGSFLAALGRLFDLGGRLPWMGAATWCGNLVGWRFGCVVLRGGDGPSHEEILDAVLAAGRAAGLGELPPDHEAAFLRILGAPPEVSGGVAVEAEVPAEGPGPVIRVELALTAPAEDFVSRVLEEVGGAGSDPGRRVAGNRLKSLAFDWAFGQPLKARVALWTHPRSTAVLNLAATTPLGIRLLPGCTESRYEMPVGRPDRGTFLFRVGSEADLREALSGLVSPVGACLERLAGAERIGRGPSRIVAAPAWVGLAVSGRHLDPSMGEIRFDMGRRHRRTGRRTDRAAD